MNTKIPSPHEYKHSMQAKGFEYYELSDWFTPWLILQTEYCKSQAN